ncbi:hypothetical protein D9M71_678190 [compost metagenome]
MIQFVKTVLQGILEGIARRHQPVWFAPFGADGQQLEYRAHRAIVIQQKTLLGLEVFDPGQVIGEAGGERIARSFIGHGGTRAQWIAPGFPAGSAVVHFVAAHYKSS